MKYFYACILISADEKFQERKPDNDMVKNYLKESIRTGEINEPCFRGRVTMKLNEVEIVSVSSK